jgi:hypothetical protein
LLGLHADGQPIRAKSRERPLVVVTLAEVRSSRTTGGDR